MVSMYYMSCNVAGLYMNKYVAHSISINTQKDLGNQMDVRISYVRIGLNAWGGSISNCRNKKQQHANVYLSVCSWG